MHLTGPDAARNGPTAPVELRDLKSDAGETHDLAAEKPDVAAKAAELVKAGRVDDPNWPNRRKAKRGQKK